MAVPRVYLETTMFNILYDMLSGNLRTIQKVKMINAQEGYRQIRRRGIAYSRKSDYKQAITDFTESIRLDPKNAKAFFNRGDAYKQWYMKSART